MTTLNQNFRSIVKSCNRLVLIPAIAKHLGQSCAFKAVIGQSKGQYQGIATAEFIFNRAAAIVIRLVENPCVQKVICRAYSKKVNRGSKKPVVVMPSGSMHRRIRQELVKNGYLKNTLKGWIATTKTKDLIKSIIA